MIDHAIDGFLILAGIVTAASLAHSARALWRVWRNFPPPPGVQPMHTTDDRMRRLSRRQKRGS